IIPSEKVVQARLVVKDEGIICGLKIFGEVFSLLDKKIKFKSVAKDGQKVRKGKIAGILVGSARAILAGERTALNFIQHLSGIATLTSRFVQKVKGTKAKIYDTRKTLPGMRALAKYAVLCGGGYNHRFSLSDMALIKDNHLILIKDIQSAVKSVRNKNRGIKVEIECKNLNQVSLALWAKADLIMFDNMDINTIKKALKMVRDFSKFGSYHPQTEVSGGVTLNTVRNFAKTGVDRISVGALTHSAPSLDISLEFGK
ncbi:MAG: carboxylating nicotinate-nucleotide diphosphorylase, partial [Elusimicrobia bacterium]|nr:carboxylating nicotinate-nucleotide diphosphorylase [Elusimicrobiota bacterium]